MVEEDHHLVLACRLGRMMTVVMTVETEDITLVTAHAAAAAGDKLKSLNKIVCYGPYLWHGIFQGKMNISKLSARNTTQILDWLLPILNYSKIPSHCIGLTYTNDNYVIGYHWPVRRERTLQCLHFLLSALRSFHSAACTPIELVASVTSLALRTT